MAITPNPPEVCPICLDELTQEDLTRTLPCGHKFHPDCIGEWAKVDGNSSRAPTCPICRRNLQTHSSSSNRDIVVLELEQTRPGLGQRSPENRRIESTLLTGIKQFSRTIACIITCPILSIFELVKKHIINRIRCSFNLCVFSTAFTFLVVLVLLCDPKEETGPDGTTTTQCKGVVNIE